MRARTELQRLPDEDERLLTLLLKLQRVKLEHEKFSHGYAVGLMLLAITNLMIPAGFYMITLQRGNFCRRIVTRANYHAQ